MVPAGPCVVSRAEMAGVGCPDLVGLGEPGPTGEWTVLWRRLPTCLPGPSCSGWLSGWSAGGGCGPATAAVTFPLDVSDVGGMAVDAGTCGCRGLSGNPLIRGQETQSHGPGSGGGPPSREAPADYGVSTCPVLGGFSGREHLALGGLEGFPALEPGKLSVAHRSGPDTTFLHAV